MTSPLTSDWLIALEPYERLFIGFSGGLDSSVLLHALASTSLQSRLIAVHVHHGISPNADDWDAHCQKVCQQLKVSDISQRVALERLNNLEERARQARYAVFSALLGASDALLLAHHQDDQAETLLLQLFRGAGVDGLAAMVHTSMLGQGHVLRPLLTHSRALLLHYAKQYQLRWIEDESNTDEGLSRNFVRHQLLPQIQKKWPSVVGNLARTATHCQQAQMNLEDLARQDLLAAIDSTELVFTSLLSQPLSRISNVLRVWLRNNKVQAPSTFIFSRIIQEVMFAKADANPEVSWGEFIVRRYQNCLYLDKNALSEPLIPLPWLNFPNPLFIKALNLNLEAKLDEEGLLLPKEASIEIRWRRGGERFFWHGQHQSLKKLLQQWRIPSWRRDKIPLFYVNGELAEIVGYAKSDLFFSKSQVKQCICLQVL